MDPDTMPSFPAAAWSQLFWRIGQLGRVDGWVKWRAALRRLILMVPSHPISGLFSSNPHFGCWASEPPVLSPHSSFWQVASAGPIGLGMG